MFSTLTIIGRIQKSTTDDTDTPYTDSLTNAIMVYDNICLSMWGVYIVGCCIALGIFVWLARSKHWSEYNLHKCSILTYHILIIAYSVWNFVLELNNDMKHYFALFHSDE